jgi:hypothetical protein
MYSKERREGERNRDGDRNGNRDRDRDNYKERNNQRGNYVTDDFQRGVEDNSTDSNDDSDFLDGKFYFLKI